MQLCREMGVGISDVEISIRMGITPSTVRQRKRRLKKKIQAMFN
jgi:DNA-binding CsgD family transcriptional regulator